MGEGVLSSSDSGQGADGEIEDGAHSCGVLVEKMN
jgi:hypothetical protein